MRLALPLAFSILAALGLGCSMMADRPNDRLHSSPAHVSEDERPLLPRRTAEEEWRESQAPLPPLPDRYLPQTANVSPENEQDRDSSPLLAVDSTVGKRRLRQVGPEGLNDLVDSYRGKVLLLNCWGVDCGPCVEELPHLNKIFREKAGKGLAIAAISTDVESRHSEVEAFVAKEGYNFDVYLRAPGPDTKFRRAIDSNYAADPFTIVFDKKGIPLAAIADALPESDWRKIVDAALAGERIPITDPEVVRLF